MGESSESLLHYWANSTPCIVSNTMAYSLLPSNVVIKVDIDNLYDSLVDLLSNYSIDENHFDICKNAYQYLLNNHNPEEYCKTIYSLIRNDEMLSNLYLEGINKEYFTDIVRHHD